MATINKSVFRGARLLWDDGSSQIKMAGSGCDT